MQGVIWPSPFHPFCEVIKLHVVYPSMSMFCPQLVVTPTWTWKIGLIRLPYLLASRMRINPGMFLRHLGTSVRGNTSMKDSNMKHLDINREEVSLPKVILKKTKERRREAEETGKMGREREMGNKEKGEREM